MISKVASYIRDLLGYNSDNYTVTELKLKVEALFKIEFSDALILKIIK